MGGGGGGGEVWRIVPRKTWASETFGPVSESWKSEVSLYLFFFFWLGASESRLFIPKDIGSLDWSFFVTF